MSSRSHSRLLLIPRSPFHLPPFIRLSLPIKLLRKTPRAHIISPPLSFFFARRLLTVFPLQSTACHTASTFYATQKKEQEAGQIRVVVVVASQVAIDTQDYFFFCKSSGLESSGISPPIHCIFSCLQSFNDAARYRYPRCF